MSSQGSSFRCGDNERITRCQHRTITAAQKMVVIVALLSFVHVCFATNQGGCQLQGEKEVGSFKDGDVLLAGSIPINFYTTRAFQNNPFSSPPNPLSCYSSRYNVGGFPWNLAMAFAISEINQDKTFLSNLTLGMLVTDSCWDTGKTIQGVLWTLSGQDKPTPNYQCRKRAMPSAIIGTTGSTASIATAVILGLHRYPQVKGGDVPLMCHFSFLLQGTVPLWEGQGIARVKKDDTSVPESLHQKLRTRGQFLFVWSSVQQ
ncbi:hypothetical protein NDU88_000642 [Pleurodeles waltl]|uniref:Receptor ligand binding region domain-containing protein n=1 Tax=Pleurodeles waltl TaxID=8319 RepID=A0AAV7KML8_PLEWA|nr:hypothetical protein NDU88_000642 [Pleurodeles waltl]